MNHHFNMQIQACTNKDFRICGVPTIWIQHFISVNFEMLFSRTRNWNV